MSNSLFSGEADPPRRPRKSSSSNDSSSSSSSGSASSGTVRRLARKYRRRSKQHSGSHRSSASAKSKAAASRSAGGSPPRQHSQQPSGRDSPSQQPRTQNSHRKPRDSPSRRRPEDVESLISIHESLENDHQDSEPDFVDPVDDIFADTPSVPSITLTSHQYNWAKTRRLGSLPATDSKALEAYCLDSDQANVLRPPALVPAHIESQLPQATLASDKKLRKVQATCLKAALPVFKVLNSYGLPREAQRDLKLSLGLLFSASSSMDAVRLDSLGMDRKFKTGVFQPSLEYVVGDNCGDRAKEASHDSAFLSIVKPKARSAFKSFPAARNDRRVFQGADGRPRRPNFRQQRSYPPYQPRPQKQGGRQHKPAAQ